MPLKASGAKQQWQGVPREAGLGRKAKIWHGHPVPRDTVGKSKYGDTVPSGMIMLLSCAATIKRGYKMGDFG